MTFGVTPNPDDEVPLCTCCAGSPGVRGGVSEEGNPVAIYFAEPAGMPKFPMLKLGIVSGRFTDDALPSHRLSLVFVCRRGADGPAMEPGEPWLATFPELTQLGERLTPAALATHPDFARFGQIARAIIAGDDRLAEMRTDPGRRRHSFTATQ
ncbi:MAG: hypothetical protein Q8M31_17015 [Beijerinckiaceae bacterium]|nr:hypothetical protein [Beijerinckiaceae bacterium]